MRNRLLLKITFLLVIFLSGCFATQQVVLDSSPQGATVYHVRGKNRKKVKLGSTPVVFKGTTTEKPVIFEVRHRGYLTTEVVVVTPYRAQTKVKVNLMTISSSWFQQTLTTDLANSVNDLLDELYEFETDLTTKSQSEAERLIAKNADRFKRFSAFHTAVGRFYYRNKQFNKAKFHFQEVLTLKPNDTEAKAMLTVIQKL